MIGALQKVFRALWGPHPPLASTTYGPRYWSRVSSKTVLGSRYLDPFLAELKRRTHLALIKRWVGPTNHCRILKTDLFEEAMGQDAILTSLSEQPAVIVGMDVAMNTVQQARWRDTLRRGTYVVADARDLPFLQGTFSMIVSTSTLDHFHETSDLGKSLKELNRVLEPNGRLIVTLDNRQNITDFILRFLGRMGWVPYYLGRSYRIDQLVEALAAAGMIVRHTTAILHNPRLMAVGIVFLANALRCRPFTTFVHRALTAAQNLEKTRFRYWTGSFIAALAVKPTKKHLATERRPRL